MATHMNKLQLLVVIMFSYYSFENDNKTEQFKGNNMFH